MIIKGKIRAIPLKHVEDGQQVYWTGCPSQVKVWTTIIEKDSLKGIYLSPYLGSPRTQWVSCGAELKQLIVEYNDKQIPLKDSEWKIVSKLDLIDKHYTIDFKIISVYVEPPNSIHCNRGGDIDMAILSPLESWDSIFDRFNQMTIESRWMYSVSYHEWLKENFEPPKPL